ncbi:MAG: PPOX class F420-dependent oxidoreductase [Chloroflexota bacterium]
MSTTIPDSHKDLIEGPVVVTLSTMMPDGQPQSSPVWCNYDGSHVLVNTIRGRQKYKNMLARPMVTILAVDPQNPYRFLEVRGAVEEMVEAGAVEHMNTLTRLYVNKPNYYGGFAPAEREGQEVRVICKIKPTRVNHAG